jgi:hypothetical protein
MELGFDTIGNATLICYDEGPVLVTDPWIEGAAYFGSWTLSHEVPEEQRAAIRACPYAWFSHGHPDHLNALSLPRFRDRTILLPDHVGRRIQTELEANGFTIDVLPDRTWRQLSPRIRVLCITDYNQDAVLLIDVGGRLLVDLNDASNNGWGWYVKRIVRDYPVAFLLALEGWGDADMINLFDEHGRSLRPDPATRSPLGPRIAARMRNYGARYFVPFSSMHRYQRADSAWAREHTTGLGDYAVGFEPKGDEILPAFIRYDCLKDSVTELGPPARPEVTLAPEEFGDDWGHPLSAEERGQVEAYFRSFAHLRTFLDFVNVRVGGRDHVIGLEPGGFGRGLTFEVPRQSLITAVSYGVFDDLLIGNFMRTIFHGHWPEPSLYPDFSPYVAKYGDNASAKTPEELRRYFRAYRERAPREYLRHQVSRRLHGVFEEGVINAFRSFVPFDSPAYRLAKRAYRAVKKPRLS